MKCSFKLKSSQRNEVIPLAKVKKICRICGKEYTPCSYCENDKMAFHYRTICCSRKCAEVYLARVLEARQKVNEIKESEPISQESVVINDDTQSFVQTQVVEEKPKRRYIKKKQIESESENVGQIDMSEGTSD